MAKFARQNAAYSAYQPAQKGMRFHKFFTRELLPFSLLANIVYLIVYDTSKRMVVYDSLELAHVGALIALALFACGTAKGQLPAARVCIMLYNVVRCAFALLTFYYMAVFVGNAPGQVVLLEAFLLVANIGVFIYYAKRKEQFKNVKRYGGQNTTDTGVQAPLQTSYDGEHTLNGDVQSHTAGHPGGTVNGQPLTQQGDAFGTYHGASIKSDGAVHLNGEHLASCPKCGSPVQGADRFCQSCGAQLNK